MSCGATRHGRRPFDNETCWQLQDQHNGVKVSKPKGPGPHRVAIGYRMQNFPPEGTAYRLDRVLPAPEANARYRLELWARLEGEGTRAWVNAEPPPWLRPPWPCEID